MTLILGFVLLAFAAPQDSALPPDFALAPDFDEARARAEAARRAHDVELERRELEHATSLPGDAVEIAKALRRLAEIEWIIYEEDELARERLLDAADVAEPDEAWRGLALLEFTRDRFGAARTAAAKAVELAETDELELWGRTVHARATLAEVEDARLAGLGDSGELESATRSAVEELRALVLGQRGHLASSRALVRGGVLVRDVAAIRLGWESYYFLDDDGRGPNAIDVAGMRSALEHWPTTTAEFVALVHALGSSRMFAEAELVTLDPTAGDDVGEDPRVRELAAYSRVLRKLRHDIPEYYRHVSLGRRDNRRLDRVLAAAWKDLAPHLVGVDADRPPNAKKVLSLASRRFGTKCIVGLTGGFYGTHFGHIVVDETRTVEQYGHGGELRFVALDNMISNGFPAWTHDGGGGTGGFAGPDEMWVIRSAHIEQVLWACQKVEDEAAMRKLEAQIVRDTAGDDARAARDPYAYLPGMAHRILYQGLSALRAELTGSGLEGEALREAFRRELEQAVLESTIFAHEGRHAIDRHLRKPGYPAPNSEYTAKLSEVAFAPRPRLAFGGILNPGIGSPSNHGVANAEIMKGIVAWMDAHADRIDGLDAARPLLAQFDLLSDEQIRSLFRSLDPLAKTQ